MEEWSFCRIWYQHVAWMIQVIWALKALPEQVQLARNTALTTSTVQQWLEGSRAFTTAVTMCSKHREWLQQCLQPCL